MAPNDEHLDGGRLIVVPEFLPLLRANGLDSFARIMAAPEGRLKRDFPGRRTSRLELRHPDGTLRAVYLKRYYPDYLSAKDRCLRRLRWPGHDDEARAEWDAVRQLNALGIPTLQVVARGQDHPSPGAVRSSFVMSAELTGAEEGHHYVARLNAADRRALLRRVAAYTRQLHSGGLVHKDLYLCHYMTTPDPAGVEPCIHLIDLQRLARPGCFAERWRVKDLAALVYSSLKSGATRTDIAAAFYVYRGHQPLTPPARRLARRVLRRVAWLKTRTPKHDTDFEQLA
jgi:hypothetical protein